MSNVRCEFEGLATTDCCLHCIMQSRMDRTFSHTQIPIDGCQTVRKQRGSPLLSSSSMRSKHFAAHLIYR